MTAFPLTLKDVRQGIGLLIYEIEKLNLSHPGTLSEGGGDTECQGSSLRSAQLSPSSISDVLKLECDQDHREGLLKQIPGLHVQCF